MSEQAEAGEVMPLEILLGVMRDRWAAGDREGAVALAKVAAPYLHGRAPTIERGPAPAAIDAAEFERRLAAEVAAELERAERRRDEDAEAVAYEERRERLGLNAWPLPVARP